MSQVRCSGCGGDGIKKPIELLVGQQGAKKRCLVCLGHGYLPKNFRSSARSSRARKSI